MKRFRAKKLAIGFGSAGSVFRGRLGYYSKKLWKVKLFLNFGHFCGNLCVMNHKNYVNRSGYADAKIPAKSDKLSQCTKTGVEKHRFSSSRCFLQNVNYGNRFVTIFSKRENAFILPFRGESINLSEFFRRD